MDGIPSYHVTESTHQGPTFGFETLGRGERAMMQKEDTEIEETFRSIFMDLPALPYLVFLHIHGPSPFPAIHPLAFAIHTVQSIPKHLLTRSRKGREPIRGL